MKASVPSAVSECRNAPAAYRAHRAAEVHSNSSPATSSDPPPSQTTVPFIAKAPQCNSHNVNLGHSCSVNRLSEVSQA